MGDEPNSSGKDAEIPAQPLVGNYSNWWFLDGTNDVYAIAVSRGPTTTITI